MAATSPTLRPAAATPTTKVRIPPVRTAAVNKDPATPPPVSAPAPVTHIDFPWLTPMGNGEPISWPCGPIGYRVVLENAPAGVLDLVKEAVRRISEVSGYEFRADSPLHYASEREIPYSGITVAWLPRAQFPFVEEDNIGRGGANWTGTKYNSGYASVLADWPGAKQPNFGPTGAGPVLLHEFGHALGLGHVDDRLSVMFPVNQGASTWTHREQEALRYLRQRCD